MHTRPLASDDVCRVRATRRGDANVSIRRVCRHALGNRSFMGHRHPTNFAGDCPRGNRRRTSGVARGARHNHDRERNRTHRRVLFLQLYATRNRRGRPAATEARGAARRRERAREAGRVSCCVASCALSDVRERGAPEYLFWGAHAPRVRKTDEWKTLWSARWPPWSPQSR